MGKKPKRELTPEEIKEKQLRQSWAHWDRTTSTGLTPDQLEADIRRVNFEMNELKDRSRQ